METADALTASPSLRVLVLEDDGEDYLLLSRHFGRLSGLKTELTHAESYDEGLEMLSQSAFDAVIVDYRLGARDGLEFIAEARDRGAACPMILLTGKGDADADLAALRVGAADYLAKDSLESRSLERSLRYAMERQRAGEALRRNDQYYRAIINNSLDLVCIIDGDARLQFESPSVTALLGYGHGERVGMDFFDFLHPGDAQETGRRLDLAVREKEGEGEGEFRMRHKDGSWRHMEYKLKNLLQLSGLKGVLFNARDITERKRGVETLLKVERMAFLGQLAAGMAHEVRNPLAIIQMSAEMIGEGGSPGGPDSLRHAATIIEQCQRLMRLMTETLNFSKNRPPELKEIAPREMLEHALKLARIQFGSAHEKIKIEWKPGGEPGAIWVDHQKAELVMVNLILNAFQAMAGGGRLCLGWLKDGGGTRFVFEDNGPGMGEKDLERIFDPFFTTKQQGSGLGLWLCQRMLDAAGGSMAVESSPEQGSRFSVWLPKMEAARENTGH